MKKNKTVFVFGDPLPGTSTTHPYNDGPLTTIPDQVVLVNFFTNVLSVESTDKLWQQHLLNYAARGHTVIILMHQNYNFLPNSCTLDDATGTDLILSNVPQFTPYWKQTLPYLYYRTILTSPITIPLALSKSLQKPTGCLLKIGSGNMIILPGLQWDHSALQTELEWTKEAFSLSHFLLTYFIDLHQQLVDAG